MKKINKKDIWQSIGIISIKKLDNTKILIGTFDKLPHDITLKNVLILITCVIKDNSTFYP